MLENMKNRIKLLLLTICIVNVFSCTKIEPSKDDLPPFITDTIPDTDDGTCIDTIPDPDPNPDPNPDPDPDVTPPPPSPERVRAIVVGEGQFGYGTGSLTSLSTKSSVTQDIFRRINGRPLGDVPQSIAEIGNYYYIPVNNSQKVEVIDSKTFKSIETIRLEGDVIPMYAVHLGGDSIAVSDQSVQNSLMIIDINHGKSRKQVRRYIDIGIQSFQMILVGNKLFVGGSKFSVFDLDNLTAEGRRDVLNRNNKSFSTCSFSKVTIDKNGNLWVVTPNNASCIDVITEKTIKEVYIPGINSWTSSIDICPKGETVYVNSGTKIYAVNIDNPIAPQEPIIIHGNNDDRWTSYHMSVSNENTIFLIRVLYGSLTRGRVFEYNTEGSIANYYIDSDGREQPYFKGGIFPHFIHYTK